MGDLKCNLFSEVLSNNSSHLLRIIDIYGLSQLITEPTRVTQYLSTLIDLCLTNSRDRVSKSGVINIGTEVITLLFILHEKLLIFAPMCIKLWKSDSSKISIKLNFCETFA